ncbi:MAG: antibiotic biosynthesis monooxygenase [Solirubrobacterales bacterium]|nr:antibiotic biosynthesis monooxygenase [Solirubrobacterales bacterium]
MIIALGDVYAQIPRVEEVRELMRATQARVREQPGCISYAFAESLDDPGRFVLVQQWRDQEALDEHYRSQTFADYQAQVAEQLVRASELRLHEVQTSYVPVDSSRLDLSQDD